MDTQDVTITNLKSRVAQLEKQVAALLAAAAANGWTVTY